MCKFMISDKWLIVRSQLQSLPLAVVQAENSGDFNQSRIVLGSGFGEVV
jgi:hypothetical protein